METNEKTTRNALTLSLGLCDTDTVYHCMRVGVLAKKLMEEYIRQYSPKIDYTPQMLQWAAMMHDVGKSRVPEKLILKSAPLTEQEYAEIKQHVALGAEMLEPCSFEEKPILGRLVTEVVRYHHERIDGKGYLEGLQGDDIPLSVQIVALADCYDSLIGARSYKPPLPPEEVVEMIVNGKCGCFSKETLSCLLAVAAQKPAMTLKPKEALKTQ